MGDATYGVSSVIGMARPSRIGVWDILSYQSPVLVATGTPRYENLGRWLVEAVACHMRDPYPSPWIPAFAGVSVLSVKYIRVAGTGDCGMRRLFPTQAGDKPPRYIFLPPSSLRFFE